MHTISNLSNSSFLMIIQRRSACKILCRLKVFCCSFPASLKPLNCFFPTSLLLWLLVVTSKATCIWAWSLTITKHQLLHTSSVYWQFVKSYYLCFPSKALILSWCTTCCPWIHYVCMADIQMLMQKMWWQLKWTWEGGGVFSPFMHMKCNHKDWWTWHFLLFSFLLTHGERFEPYAYFASHPAED